jgi:radical SAM superfamily enzyme YgiQ (UPF0313 family)
MRVLLVALNSKYIHSSLALRYLKAFCSDKPYDIGMREFTINDPKDLIAGEIIRENADIVAFSVYIWNVTETLSLAARIKKIRNDITIIMGGPEVSYDSRRLMEECPFIDYVVRGEGEVTFRRLLECLVEGSLHAADIEGLTFRDGERVIVNDDREPIGDLSIIPFPYDGEHDMGSRIVYYEASRGCPFQCQYCLSSVDKGVRFQPIERVKDDLNRLIQMRVKQVKFVDRTFNCNKDFALEIFKFLIERGGKTNFHFEISADLLDQQTLEVLAGAPPGLFQFEVGVQTTNIDVLREIRRNTSLKDLFKNVTKIKEHGNIHQHLDLIAGLPGEDFKSFAISFDDVFSLRPDMLQLGFLKLLKGTGIKNRQNEYGYIFTDEPPYEVLGNKWISYNDILRLKMVEEVVEHFYNSHRFDNTIEYILARRMDSPFELFEDISRFWEGNGLHLSKHSQKNMYAHMYRYMTKRLGIPRAMVNELLKYDFLLSEKALVLPEPIARIEIPLFKQRCYDFLGNQDNVDRYLPDYRGLASKNILKLVHFEAFGTEALRFIKSGINTDSRDISVVLFDYRNRDKIRGKARAIIVQV